MALDQTVEPEADAPWGIDWASGRTWVRYLAFLVGQGVLLGVMVVGVGISMKLILDPWWMALLTAGVAGCVGILLLKIIQNGIDRYQPVRSGLNLDVVRKLHPSLRIVDRFATQIVLVEAFSAFFVFVMVARWVQMDFYALIFASVSFSDTHTYRNRLRRILAERLAVGEKPVLKIHADNRYYQTVNWWIVVGFGVSLLLAIAFLLIH